MHDSKKVSWADNYDADASEDASANDRDAGAPSDEQSDPDGWQQYRRWISKAPVPRGRRTGVDPSLYTWKGYRSWTEQIKRNWSDN
jgi:hypothetical protein